ncbi:hypothetical protein [Lysinibacillus sp. G4S2]|uniref:hypothetical protein n=1 Tax=Lysinibacillus sp. G4S2 TaxID=3055859 RepID=UPI0025A01C2B|nr:hypothetical protein [Lysinibacillus sp. G4S2]MDM5245748.1 hypothetical protein [Lysinibacillus sp. G4S2]
MANEIVIKMSSANEPPKITLNGKKIKGIIGLEYNYATSNAESNGQHNFVVRYIDEDTSTIRAAIVHKTLEG